MLERRRRLGDKKSFNNEQGVVGQMYLEICCGGQLPLENYHKAKVWHLSYGVGSLVLLEVVMGLGYGKT